MPRDVTPIAATLHRAAARWRDRNAANVMAEYYLAAELADELQHVLEVLEGFQSLDRAPAFKAFDPGI